ncbi:hypothetical protein [Nocardia sp. NPDC020380]|uniref:hypothetical protein n=1 Tax=Nocardia sp. NPDC020380 TaxID=3364309 RepID=UPI0037A19336
MIFSKSRQVHDVRSWRSVWNTNYSAEAGYPDSPELDRLRGLITAQAAETEQVLGLAVRILDATADLTRPAESLLDQLRQLVPDSGVALADDLTLIGKALARRSFAVHAAAAPIPDWPDYGGGAVLWQPVVSTVDDRLYTDDDLHRDFTIQVEATGAAVRILRILVTRTIATTAH